MLDFIGNKVNLFKFNTQTSKLWDEKEGGSGMFTVAPALLCIASIFNNLSTHEAAHVKL